MSPVVRRSQAVVVHLLAHGVRRAVHGWVDDIDELFLRIHLPGGDPLPAVGDLVDVVVAGVEVRATVQEVAGAVITVLRPVSVRPVPSAFDPSVVDEPGDRWDLDRDPN